VEHKKEYIKSANNKASDIKIGDIPKEYNNDPKILASTSSYSKDRQEKDSLITRKTTNNLKIDAMLKD